MARAIAAQPLCGIRARCVTLQSTLAAIALPAAAAPIKQPIKHHTQVINVSSLLCLQLPAMYAAHAIATPQTQARRSPCCLQWPVCRLDAKRRVGFVPRPQDRRRVLRIALVAWGRFVAVGPCCSGSSIVFTAGSLIGLCLAKLRHTQRINWHAAAHPPLIGLSACSPVAINAIAYL